LFTIFTLLCIGLQIGLLSHVITRVASLNNGYIVVSPFPLLLASQSRDAATIRPCVVPAITNYSGSHKHQCSFSPSNYCPTNYSCSRIGQDSWCFADSFVCGDNYICQEIISNLSVPYRQDFPRVLPCSFEWPAFYVCIGLLSSAMFFIIVAALVLKFCARKMHDPRCVFPTLIIFGLLVATLVALSLARFLSSFTPSIYNQAALEAADCFENNAEDWFFYFLFVSISSVSLMCLTILSLEIIVMGTISFYVHGIHALFWNCNTFVILSVLIAISFGVSCFIIFANALNEY